MTIPGAAFARRSGSLLGAIVRSPNRVVSELPNLDTAFCVRFGWMCFFFSTLSTALIQIFFLDLLEGFLSNPQNFAQVAEAFKGSFGTNLEEFRKQLVDLRAVSFVNALLAPLSAWFFPHLLSGALFVLLQLLSVTKNAPGTYDNLIKLVSISFGLFIFCAVPLIGPVLGNIWWFVFIVSSTGSLFSVPIVGRVSAALLAAMVLFSIWNATVARLATTLV